MDAQSVLDAYVLSPGDEGDRYWESLSDVVRDLVHRSIGKREVGDLEDFEEDCVLAIWTKINALKTGESDSGIDNLEAFVRRAVHNRYCDVIRRKRPKWYNLKLELLELCSGKANVDGFALWQNPESGARLCGFTDWKGKTRPASAKCRELTDNPDTFREHYLANRDPQELPTHELASAVFDYCGACLEVDLLTSCIAELTRAYNPEPLSIDVQPSGDEDAGAPVDWLVSPDDGVEEQVVDTAWFNHVIDWFWKEFMELSVKQRTALLYGMGADQVMALASSVGMRQIARSLEIEVDRLASLISELPIPDVETAEILGIQARAVPSVRFKAWGRIRRRTRKSSLVLEEEDAPD